MKRHLSSFTLLVLAMLGSLACDSDSSPPPSGTIKGDRTADAVATPARTVVTTNAPPGAATFRVLAGRSEGNRDVEAFMPADIRIRAGDTIEWTAKGFEGHTITFGDGDDTLAGIGDYLLPNPADPSERIFNPTLSLPSEKQGTHDGTSAFINSGFIGIPLEQTYGLTFAQAGLFTYLCLVHPFTMTGTVTVEASDADVPSPEFVSQQGDAELADYMEELQVEARRIDAGSRAVAGPDGSSIHYVQVGAITDRGQMAVYLPGAIDIAAGDTVIFQNDDRNFHNVIFKGAGELPPGIGIVPDPGGRGLNFSLSNASAIAVDPPADGFDETTFLSSGSMGVLQPRLTWTLRFARPGTYVYACTIHTLAGMTGVITVK